MEKIQSSEQKLVEYCKGHIYRGLITGLTEAFVIDRETKDELISSDPTSADRIRPFLRGTHLRTWNQELSNQWWILFPSGFTEEKSGLKDEAEAAKWMRENFGSLFAYLSRFERAARSRQDKGRFWWELRACDYYDQFEKPKVLWPDIAKLPRFSIDVQGHYVGNTAYFIPSDDYYLLGVLNSWVAWFVISKIAQPLRLRKGRWQYRCFQQYMEPLPIPTPPEKDRKPIAKLAQQISEWAQERYEVVEKVCRRFHDLNGGLIESKLSQKLQDWPSLTFTQIGTELKKAFRLPRSPWQNPRVADEWERYWNDHHGRHETLTRQIASAENELNQRIYRLFNLTPEEIKLLESEVAS